jgi:hypothetical protein
MPSSRYSTSQVVSHTILVPIPHREFSTYLRRSKSMLLFSNKFMGGFPKKRLVFMLVRAKTLRSR